MDISWLLTSRVSFLAPLCRTTLNTFAFLPMWSLIGSWLYTISITLLLIALSMLRSIMVCMASHKQPLLPTNNCRNNSHDMATALSQSLLVYGNMILAPVFHSHCWWHWSQVCEATRCWAFGW
jgi:hypothetical protein